MAKVGRCFAVRRIFGSISVAIDTGVTNLPLNVDGSTSSRNADRIHRRLGRVPHQIDFSYSCVPFVVFSPFQTNPQLGHRDFNQRRRATPRSSYNISREDSREKVFFLSFLQEEENQFILNQLGKSERGERREYKREKERVVHPSEGRAAYEAAQSPALVRI